MVHGYEPTRHVRRPPHAQRAPGVNQRAHGVVVPSCYDEFLVHRRRPGLFTRDKTRAHPYARRTVRQGHRESPSVCDPARSNDDDGLPRQRAPRVLAQVDAGRNENREGRVTRVPAAFAALRADKVDT